MRDSLRCASARYPRLFLPKRRTPPHQTQQRLLQAGGRRAGTWRWPERSVGGPVLSPYHRVGWGRAGRRSELLGDAQATQTAESQKALPQKSVGICPLDVSHRSAWSLCIMYDHALCNGSPASAYRGQGAISLFCRGSYDRVREIWQQAKQRDDRK